MIQSSITHGWLILVNFSSDVGHFEYFANRHTGSVRHHHGHYMVIRVCVPSSEGRNNGIFGKEVVLVDYMVEDKKRRQRKKATAAAEDDTSHLWFTVRSRVRYWY